jgi:hypothetical protein
MIDAEEVMAALQAALELAEVWIIDGTGNLDDRLRLHQQIKEWQKREGRLSMIASECESAIIADLDEPREVDGQWWRTKRKAVRRGWDREALRSAINRQAFAERRTVDEMTGEIDTREPSTAEVVATIWAAADVATGRTKVLRQDFDLDLDEYAQTEWVTSLEACDLIDIRPTERDHP